MIKAYSRAREFDPTTESSPLVSILIPCRNAEAWIEECVRSAIAQTYQNKEIILLDDGSTDRSIEAVKPFEKWVRIERGEPRGVSKARNRLLELSRGKWVNFLDADDYLLPEKIEEQLSVVGERISVVYSPPLVLEPRLRDLSSDVGLRDSLHWRTSQSEADLFAAFFQWEAFQTSALLFKRSCLVDVGGWSEVEPICHEHELIMRLLLAGKGFAPQPKALSVYRRQNSNSISRADPIATIKSRMMLSDLLEERLFASKRLTHDRCKAVSEARLAMARAAYQLDQTLARAISIQATKYGKLVVHRNSKIYTYLFRCFGIDVAEGVAQAFRSFRRTFCKMRTFTRITRGCSA